MRWLLLLLIPAVGAQPVITGVVPDLSSAYDFDEGVGLTSATDWPLEGYGLSDGEDTWWFPPGAALVAGEEAWVVGNPVAWAQFDGPAPRWTFDLQLGNNGDEVSLIGPTSDAMAYDASMLSGRAQVLRGDWVTPRVHRVGESALDAPQFDADATLYASPDATHKVLLDLLASATKRVHLHVYQLSEPRLVDALAAAAARGLDVHVMVEDHPVGEHAEERATADAALGQIHVAGGEVYRAGSGRYAYHHLKVLIADDSVAIQSENWVRTGTPVDASWGNRGWGVALHDLALADWFADWMATDRAAWDTEPVAPNGVLLRQPAPTGSYRAVAPQDVAGVVARPFISPDHTADPAHDPVLALIRNATRSIDVQQLDLALEAKSRIGWSAPDGLTAALAEAAARGVAVRVQAAAPFRADDTGNREALAWLSERGVQVSEFDRAGIVALHNKGLIVDDRFVVIGSMNGNHHSRSNNREVGVIVDHPDAAAYYGALFDSDWNPVQPRDWNQVARDLESIPVSPWPILLAVAAVARSYRCSP